MVGQDSSRHEQVAEAFASAATEEYGDQIEDIFVFGSTSRGDTRGIDSDIDMFVVVTDDAITDGLRDLAYDIQLEYTLVVSVHIQTTERFTKRQDHPFIQPLLTEGRSYTD